MAAPRVEQSPLSRPTVRRGSGGFLDAVSPVRSPALGATYMLAASCAFAAMGTLVKLAAVALPPTEIVAWRSAVSAVLVLLLARRSGADLRPRNRPMHVVRALTGVASMACYFTAISRLHLGDAVLLTYLSPLFVAALSPWTVGERPRRRVLFALALGLVGVALVARPGGALDPVGLAAGLLAAILAACAYLSVRVLTRTDTTIAIVWWFSALGTLAAGTSFLDGASLPTGPLPAILLGIGLLGAVAQWWMTRAYAVSEAAVVAVYAYATPVVAYLLGLAVLGEVPRPESLLGAVLVVLAGWTARR